MAAPIPHSTSALKSTVDAKSNLPNFESVTYNFPLSSDDVPQILFSDIYFHLVSRKTFKNVPINNVKGMDKAVKHYDASDVGKIEISQVI